MTNQWNNNSKILAIDAGNVYSGYVVIDSNLRPIESGKIENEILLEKIRSGAYEDCQYVALEMIASYGMAVGKTVFDTCVWIGIFKEALKGKHAQYIYRKDEKMNLCHNNSAKDANIIQALIDRFAPDTPNKGKGNKQNPGWFYGFAKDIWQAYAVGVTFYDMYIR